MKLLFQSDDYGFTEAITYGILKGIREGVIRNTGLFTNMPSSALAASHIKDHPECCFGVDINIVAGRPVSDPLKIPGLVDEHGVFIASTQRNLSINSQNEKVADPFIYEEVVLEARAQVNRFIELVGHKPEYLHPHSVMTDNLVRALRDVAREFEIPFSMEFLANNGVHFVSNDWNPKPFNLDVQSKTDVTHNTLRVLPEVLEHEASIIICHAGFVDDAVLENSTYSLIRVKDLAMATSPAVKEYLNEHQIELITYRDLM
ncbi:ChbG/HpnK family deacetylase [Erysipelothrix sp. HDW6C]|uniref:ChbG/HpnK family deacetylase n=1 Tax=Erysipelothrix sp. HDW6C TaxID=2714930 RepID=UPI001407859E|nr:ChbG/HpnK family deacetylase [Erysipelothrix sp. HDW6C]QIK68836.1 ChbG/HpnK family deacetylase [Erysipelothrix sp. HDW6C]